MNCNDSTRIHKPHPNDGTAMRRYSQTFAYDEVGNLLEVVHTPSSGTGWTRTYTIDSSSNQLDVNSIGSNAPTAETYTYDARGNIITGFNHLDSLTYNEENRLEKVILADTNITCYYQYDGQGQRVRKVTVDDNSNGYTQVRKYIGSWEVYDKIDGNNDVVLQRETLHIMDDRARVALIDTPVVDTNNTGEVQLLRYQFSNHLQTATLELDYAAAVISYEEYYPFGSTSFQSGRSAAEVSLKRYRYTGKERDEETGLYYHGARYYAPWLCRWCAVDPLESDYTPQTSYAYCSNNPVMRVDATGMGDEEYAIQKGDTLSGIAKSHNTSVDALMKANPQIEDKDKIFAGKNLTIPGQNQNSTTANSTESKSCLDLSVPPIPGTGDNSSNSQFEQQIKQKITKANTPRFVRNQTFIGPDSNTMDPKFRQEKKESIENRMALGAGLKTVGKLMLNIALVASTFYVGPEALAERQAIIKTTEAISKTLIQVEKSTSALVASRPAIPEIAGTLERTYLMPGRTIDRFGAESGRWFSTPEVSFGARSIPPGTAPYKQFTVLKPFEVQQSVSAPGMMSGQIGLGLQFESPVSAKILLKRNIIGIK